MSEARDELAARLHALHARARAHEDPPGRHAAMRARVLARVEPAAPLRLRVPAFVAAGVGAVLVALLAWSTWRPTPLGFTRDGELVHVQTQAFVVAGEEPVTLRFTDGGRVQVHAHAQLRLDTREGAQLVLERGTIELELGADDEAAWRVDAGPYRVTVLGHAAALQWTPERAELELDPRDGRVEVRGPGVTGTRVLDPGERIVLAAEALVVAERQDANVRDPVAPSDAVPIVPPAPVDTTDVRASRIRKPNAAAPSVPDWRELARAGSYAEALDAAEAAGFTRLCAAVDADALLELADVGRYAKRPGRAIEALTALRRRFPASEAAAAAAFDLGRLRAQDCAAATPWFATYLRERPRGPMAQAARQRIDECSDHEADQVVPAP